jgi:hypothetical protein
MHRTGRLVVASAIAVVVTAAFVPGSGYGSSAAVSRNGRAAIPAGLAAAIHARFGAGMIRSGVPAPRTIDPNLGFSVSLSSDGTTALVGAPGVDGNRGAAYIFHASAAGSWTSHSAPTATLMKRTTKPGQFGRAVALSADGTTAFVGAPIAGAGFIYVFQVSSEDAWSSSSAPKATLTVSHGEFVGLGLALSSDGTTLVAGDPFYKFPTGGAFVFHVASENAWVSTSSPTATLSLDDLADDLAGYPAAISADGTTVLISDFGNTTGGGAAVYHVASENAWTSTSTPTAILSNENGNPNDSLGNALALSADGTVAFLGAPGVKSDTGAVDVFYAAGEAAWTTMKSPTAILTVAGGASHDLLGLAGVAVSSDGTTALVFAPGAHGQRGAGYVFSAPSEGAWASAALSATLTNSGARPKDFLGDAAALSPDGATVLVGAPGVRLDTGSAAVFHVSNENSWAPSSSPAAVLTVNALAACVVPRLKGLKLGPAKVALTAGRCRLGKVSKVHSRTRRSRGRVLSQNRKAGRRLAVDAKVAVKVGK